MAPKVQLMYFDIRARAEIVRIMLNYGGIEFEDKRVQNADWPKVKPTTKFGFMPELTWDGKVLGQSTAIARFVAREVGIAGRSNLEMAQCDTIVDFCCEVVEAAPAVAFAPDEAKKKEAKENFKTKLDGFIVNMEKLLDENGGEWMVGKWFTWADLYVVVVLHQWAKKMAGVDFESEKLSALSKRVYNIPKIKSYIDNRPDRPM